MKTKVRFGVAFTLFILFLVAYLDRSNVTLLIADLEFLNDLGIADNHTAQGLLMTVFLIMYAIGNFVLGPATDKLGPRKTLFIAYTIWGFLMVLMGIIPILAIMLFFRGILGLAEGPVTPVTTQVVERWFPPQERTMANAVWTFGLLLAPALAIPVIGLVIHYVGWQWSFIIVGVVGAVIPAVLTYVFLYDTPDKHPHITNEEKNHILSGDDSSVTSANIESGNKSFSFLRKIDFWLVCLLYTIGNAVIWGLISWFPSYVSEVFNLNLASSGFYASLPYIASIILMIVFSPIIDRTPTKAWGLIVGTVLTTVSMGLSLVMGGSIAVTITLALAVGGSYMQSPVCFNIIQRIVPSNRVATAGGIMNGTAYLLGASSAPIAFGYLVDVTNSYTTGFVAMFFMGIILIITASILFWREKKSLMKLT